MNNKKSLVLIILIVLSLLVSCAKSEFDSEYEKFKDSYIGATNFLEKDNDSLKALKIMDVNSVEAELKKMKESMDNMSSELNTKNEKGIYSNVKNYYAGVEFFLYAAKNIDKLSIDEKRKVYLEADFASMNRKHIKEGEV